MAELMKEPRLAELNFFFLGSGISSTFGFSLPAEEAEMSDCLIDESLRPVFTLTNLELSLL